jgi:hypothetical protein
MLKEAIEKIVSLAQPQIIDRGDHTFSIDADGAATEIRPVIDTPDQIELSSLDAIVKLVKTEALKLYAGVPIYITVPAHTKVEVFLQPNSEKREMRVSPYLAFATDVPGWDSSVKLPFDQAAVALMTRFQDGGDRDYTLQLLSQITTGAHVTYNDTGIATTVVTQKGVSLQQNTQIKPLVKLRPYRTFQEVEQPEGLFLIRIDERGITFTEADGGMWKLTARQTVKTYLETNLADDVNAGNVIVML